MKKFQLLLLSACCAMSLACAQNLPVSARLGMETITLPGDEAMGLAGGSYLLELSPHWLAGPAVYGATTGHRGGFFVGGAELTWRLPLGERTRLETGVFAGGGGGGGAPVGGGLMLRPHIDVLWNLGPRDWWAGVSASSVRFPNGQIRSQQAGLVLMLDSDFVYATSSLGGRTFNASDRGGMGFDRIQVQSAQLQARSGPSPIGLAGFRLDQWLSPQTYWGLDAAGAASGGAGGYAEVLGTLGFESPILHTPISWGARAALGLGGGGAVPTEGGTLAKAGGSLTWHMASDLSVSLEAGQVVAPQGPFRARYVQAALVWDLDHPRVHAPTRSATTTWIEGMEWDIAFEHVNHAARKKGPPQALQSIGLQVQRSLNDWLYLSGQAHSAFNGQAGAYSMGLVGAGLTTPQRGSPWSLAAELLMGAAGGGGVDTQGGAVIQPMLKLNWAGGPQSRVHVGFGLIRSLHGKLSSPVIELAWGLAFGVPTH